MSSWLYTFDGTTQRIQLNGHDITDSDSSLPIGNIRLYFRDERVCAVEIREASTQIALAPTPSVPPVLLAPENEPAPKKSKRTEQKPTKVRKCSQCGHPGHTARTCGSIPALEIPKLTEDEIKEIRERRSRAETTSEIAAVMELPADLVATVKEVEKAQTAKKPKQSIEEKVRKMVQNGADFETVRFAFPTTSERALEEAYSWALHDLGLDDA